MQPGTNRHIDAILATIDAALGSEPDPIPTARSSICPIPDPSPSK